MTIQRLQEVYRARPFKPFNIHMADGRVLHVPHSEFMAMSPTGRTVVVYDAEDNLSILDLLLMSEIRVPAGQRNDRDAA
jgi:hypothetical protein